MDQYLLDIVSIGDPQLSRDPQVIPELSAVTPEGAEAMQATALNGSADYAAAQQAKEVTAIKLPRLNWATVAFVTINVLLVVALGAMVWSLWQ